MAKDAIVPALLTPASRSPLAGIVMVEQLAQLAAVVGSVVDGAVPLMASRRVDKEVHGTLQLPSTLLLLLLARPHWILHALKAQAPALCRQTPQCPAIPAPVRSVTFDYNVRPIRAR